MLVLTRKLGEKIMISDDIVVTVVAFGQGGDKKVRLGIEAPPDVKVLRQEVHDRLRGEEK